MTPVPDPYRLLGVARGASLEEIKAAHRSLAKRYHPDAGEADTGRFLAVQEAYQLLSDPLRRRDWDLRHAPGPVRAGEGVTMRGSGRAPGMSRPRSGSGPAASARTTRTGGGPATTGTGGGPARPTGGPARPTGAPAGSADRTAAGGSPRGAGEPDRTAGGRSSASTEPGGGTEPGTQDARRSDAGGPWAASDRDPAARSYTWSAQGVPWWEDGGPREARRPPGTHRSAPAQPETTPPAANRAPSAARPVSGPAAERERETARASGPDGPGGQGGQRGHEHGTGQHGQDAQGGQHGGDGKRDPGGREGWKGQGAASGSTGAGGEAGPLPQAPVRNDFDVYSRSSGAAWSSASRAYFRRAEADLPRRGVFRMEGTTPVTGAAARRAAAEEDARGPRATSGPGAEGGASSAGRATPSPGPAGTTQDDRSSAQAGGRTQSGTPPRSTPMGAWRPSDPSPGRPGGARATQALGTIRRPPSAAWILRAALGRAQPWPTAGERIAFAALAWVPLALLIAYGGGWATGCDRAAAACSSAVEPAQATLIAVALAVFTILPRVAYVATWGSVGLAATALLLLFPATIIGNREPIPTPIAALGLGVLVAGYIAGVALAARDRPWPRPWTVTGDRRS